MLDREQCRGGLEIAYRAASGDQVSAFLCETVRSTLIFAGGRLVASGQRDEMQMTVRVCAGRRSAVARTNELTGSGMRQVAIKASEMAKAMPEDPTHVGVLPPQGYQEVAAAFDAGTAALSSSAAAELVAAALAASGSAASGRLEWRTRVWSVGSSLGNFGYHRSTEVLFALESGGGRHGFASQSATRVHDLDLPALARQALARAVPERELAPAPGGTPATIVAPPAAAAIVRCAQRAGQVPASLRLQLDPAHALLLAAPFDEAGRPARDAFVCDAGDVERAPHSSGGNGVLVTRLSEVPAVSAAAGELIGVACGAWLLAAGEPVRPVRDFVWRLRAADVLSRVVASGPLERVQASLDEEPVAIGALRLRAPEGSP